MKAESINLRNAEILLHIEVVKINLLLTFMIFSMIGRKFVFLKPYENQRRIHFTQQFFQTV
jgi:hypothetical protein